jgi:hypothetical protein
MAEAGASRDTEEDEEEEEKEVEEEEDEGRPDEVPPVAKDDSQAAEDNETKYKANIITMDDDEVWCPITDKNEKPFRLMDLPPEIRIEIYRACLTRPFDIMLSREPKPPEAEKERSFPRAAAAAGEERDRDRDRDRDGFDEVLTELPESVEDGDDDDHQQPMVVTARGQDGSPVHAIGFRPRMRSLRLRRNAGGNSNNTINVPNDQDPVTPATPSSRSRPIGPQPQINNPLRGRRTTITTTTITSTVLPPRAARPQDVDPLLVKLLCASKLIYKEARAILYGENNFLLDLDTAQITLAALHQRSRGQIKNLRVTIPTHNEILERFTEVVRLSLRYCWRLKRFVVHMPFVLPGAEGSSTSGNTTVYANAFDILRWLPKQCEVSLEGNVCEEIRRVVEKNANLAKSLDEVSYDLYAKNGHLVEMTVV